MATKKERGSRNTEKATSHQEQRHGISFPDNYRYLEDPSLPQTQDWIDNQNFLANTYFEESPLKSDFLEKLNNLTYQDVVGEIIPVSGRYFYEHSDPNQQYTKICMFVEETQEHIILFDPNEQTEACSIDWWIPSDDGSLLSYGISFNGDEDTITRILRTETGEVLDDIIPHTRDGQPSWLPGGEGFYYVRYDRADDGANMANIYLHLLGQDWQEDKLVLASDNPHQVSAINIYDTNQTNDQEDEETNQTEWFVLVTSKDTATGLGSIKLGMASNDDLVPELVPILDELTDGWMAKMWRGVLMLLTVQRANHGEVLFTPPNNNQINDLETWQPLMPEDEERLLTWFGMTGGYLVLSYLNRAKTEVYVIDVESGMAGDPAPSVQLELPEVASVPDIKAGGENGQFMYSCEAPDLPLQKVIVDIKPDMTLEEKRFSGLSVPPEYIGVLSAIETEQVFVTSLDGEVEIPMFIAMIKDENNTQPRKTILNAYGGFGINSLPEFRYGWLELMSMGYAIASVGTRGEGFDGEQWHQAGAFPNKQKPIDDLIAAAQYLIDAGITEPSKLGIRGTSHGAWLVVSAAVQRPDLFAAVVPEAGIYDLARYDETSPYYQYLTKEFGDPNQPTDLPIMLQTSPYHQVSEQKYPAMYFIAGENDARLSSFGHTAKMVAALQAANQSDKPIIAQFSDTSGHFGGDSRQEIIEQSANILTFFEEQLV